MKMSERDPQEGTNMSEQTAGTCHHCGSHADLTNAYDPSEPMSGAVEVCEDCREYNGMVAETYTMTITPADGSSPTTHIAQDREEYETVRAGAEGVGATVTVEAEMDWRRSAGTVERTESGGTRRYGPSSVTITLCDGGSHTLFWSGRANAYVAY